MKKIFSRYRFIAIFFISIAICLMITGAYIHGKIQLDYSKMENLAYTRAVKVTNVVSALLYKTQALSGLVIQNNGEVKDFNRVAATITDSPAIRNVIIAPQGIVTQVYPLEGNEALIGFDYFSDMAGNREAIAARDSGELVLGGPFDLIQGGQALVGRLPVYLDSGENEKAFWGLVSVTLNYPEALDSAELDQLQEQGFAYEIWRIDPDTGERQSIAASTYDYNKHSRYVERPFTILNAQWSFRLSPIKEWYQYTDTWLYLFSGLIISYLVTLLYVHNFQLRQIQKDMESLTNSDFLTGAANRRGIFAVLEDLMSQNGRGFLLSYIDINKFKQINDTYGHNMGDKVLREFAYILKRNIEESSLLARIGGDEFILVFMDTDDLEMAESFFANIHKELKHSPVCRDLSGGLTFSVGYSCFPADGTTVDKLIEVADHHMYGNKGKNRQY